MSLRQTMILRVAVLTSVAAWNALSADGPADRSRDEAITFQQLQAQLSELETRVQKLEDQQTGIQPAAGSAVPAPRVYLPEDAAAGHVPRNWRKGEINGLRFYTIPLSIQQKGD